MTESADHTTDCTLVLFTKRPRPGVGKQRVAAESGTSFAFQLARRLFDCAAEDLSGWPGPRAICIDDVADMQWAAGRCPRARVLVQGDGNLGERLQRTTHALSRNAGPLLFIGSDAPTLDLGYLLDAARALAAHDIVLGAADDGGVVAMGCRSHWPALAPLPWSTAALGAQLAAACEAAGLRVAWLPSRTDVDTPDALAAVAQRLAVDPRPARRALVDWFAQTANGDAATYATHRTGTSE